MMKNMNKDIILYINAKLKNKGYIDEMIYEKKLKIIEKDFKK